MTGVQTCALRSRLDEVVALDLEAIAAVGGDALEFRLDPVGGGADTGAGRKIGVHAGEGAAVVEGDELFDGGANAVGGDLVEGGGDGGIGWSGGYWRLCAEGRADQESGERKGDAKTGIVLQDHHPLWKPNRFETRRLDVPVVWR